MISSVQFALLSLVCAGVNDVVFKRYSSQDRSRGMYVFGIGLVWTLLQIATLGISGQTLILDSTSLVYGLAAGLLLTTSNLFLLESLTHIDASLGSTIYRLNTIGVVLLSMFLLHEPLDTFKIIGVVLGLLAVFLLYRHNQQSGSNEKRYTFFFALAITASLFRALYGVTSKAGFIQGASLQSLLLIGSICWIFGGVGYALFREKRFKITRGKALYSLASGILVFLIVNFLMLAVEHGQASIVIPIANMSFVAALILSVALKMETLSKRKLLAVAVSVAAIFFLSLSV
ncbi:MAG: EamA family transporter [Thermodesulfobacteriota bacterium]|nr:EamA family transporter [Thermodesulfobacteriota bacterium]